MIRSLLVLFALLLCVSCGASSVMPSATAISSIAAVEGLPPLRNAPASVPVSVRLYPRNFQASGLSALALSSTAGSTLRRPSTNTIDGPTDGLSMNDAVFGAAQAEFISEPLAVGIVLSGPIAFNVWASESSMKANVGMHVIVERMDATGHLSLIVNAEYGAELTRKIAPQYWSATPTPTVMVAGDRVRVRILGNDAGGEMAHGFTFTVDYNADANGADGDTWVQFTETLTFQ